MRTVLGLFAAAIATLAQTVVTSAPQIAVRSGVIGGTITAFNGNFSVQGVVGRPYSAEQITEHVQTLADGTHISQAMQTTKIWRDSAAAEPDPALFQVPAEYSIVDEPAPVVR